MYPRKIITITLIMAVALLNIVPALAALPAQTATSLCPVGEVSGTVVAVDGTTGTVTVELGDGSLCTVNINVDENHPIVLLLGKYFGDVSPATLEGALGRLKGCAVDNGDFTWSWVDADAQGNCPEGTLPVKVTGDNGDGTFTAVVEDENGTEVTVLKIVDEATADTVKGALETLAVAWTLDGEGDLWQVSDQIATYHEEGMGFGVLVKLYAIAQEHEDCAEPASEGESDCLPTSVEELVVLFQSGVGMGQIFKDYGKPEKLGVGHVRQEYKQDKEKDKFKDTDKNQGKDKKKDSNEQSWPASADKKNNKDGKDNKGLKDICNAVTKKGKPKGGAACP